MISIKLAEQFSAGYVGSLTSIDPMSDLFIKLHIKHMLHNPIVLGDTSIVV
jgi:hypothetical protein